MSSKSIGTITYDITTSCNLRCKHCYNTEYLSTNKPVEINISETIDAFSKISFQNILIQGGEPLMVNNLEQLINQFSRKKINVFLTTNATLLDVSRSIQLIRSGLKGIFFSVESASEEINDAIRGQGTFQTFYKNVKNFMNIYLALREKKIIPPIQLALSCTTSSINFGTESNIRNMFNFTHELGMSNITFNFLVNHGACKNLTFNKDTTNFKIANKIVQISKEFPDICVRLPMKQIEHDFFKKRYGIDINICGAKGSCPAGDKVAYVDANLNMYPCIWPSHNVLNRASINDVISLKSDISSTVFTSFLKRKQTYIGIFQECKTCKYNKTCIPVCPYQDEFEIINCTGQPCPTRMEIKEIYNEQNTNSDAH